MPEPPIDLDNIPLFQAEQVPSRPRSVRRARRTCTSSFVQRVACGTAALDVLVVLFRIGERP